MIDKDEVSLNSLFGYGQVFGGHTATALEITVLGAYLVHDVLLNLSNNVPTVVNRKWTDCCRLPASDDRVKWVDRFL